MIRVPFFWLTGNEANSNNNSNYTWIWCDRTWLRMKRAGGGRCTWWHNGVWLKRSTFISRAHNLLVLVVVVWAFHFASSPSHPSSSMFHAFFFRLFYLSLFFLSSCFIVFLFRPPFSSLAMLGSSPLSLERRISEILKGFASRLYRLSIALHGNRFTCHKFITVL